MSSTNIEQVMPVKLAQALANPLFPALDSALRSGRHIGLDELDNHAFLMDFQEYLEEFYARYNVELIRAPEGFFYLRPRSTTLIPRSVLSELDMMQHIHAEQINEAKLQFFINISHEIRT
ncbi:MAG: chromosome partition protein MukE, partial [Escherichia coli]|nr:chromosome partition protein MukE [Escherichia coli]